MRCTLVFAKAKLGFHDVFVYPSAEPDLDQRGVDLVEEVEEGYGSVVGEVLGVTLFEEVDDSGILKVEWGLFASPAFVEEFPAWAESIKRLLRNTSIPKEIYSVHSCGAAFLAYTAGAMFMFLMTC